jgi:hypothetical protein
MVMPVKIAAHGHRLKGLVPPRDAPLGAELLHQSVKSKPYALAHRVRQGKAAVFRCSAHFVQQFFRHLPPH